MSIEIPLKGEVIWTPPAELMSKWAACYPSLNIEIELTRAATWSASNPKRRKTVAGVARFCTNWLAKEQKKNPNRRAGMDPNLARHLHAADEIIRARFNKREPIIENGSTYRFNLTRLIDKVIEDVFNDTDNHSTEHTKQSAVFGTVSAVIQKAWK